MYATLYVDGDQVPTGPTSDEFERVNVVVDDEGVIRQYRCRRCSEELDEDNHAPDAPEAWVVDCSENFDGEEGDARPHEPEPIPLAWVNHATITLDEDDDAVHVSISVGDPRGGFTFTVRRLSDGRLVMHTPYPGEPMPHATLEAQSPGTYVIVGG